MTQDQMKARVDKVHFDGIKRTRDDILLYAVRDLLKARSVQEVVREALKVRQQLETLKAFKSIYIISLDRNKGPDASPHGLGVIFNVEEKSRMEANIKLTDENNDVSPSFGFSLPNIFGRGEAVSANYQYDKKSVGFNVTSTKHFLHRTKPRLNSFVLGNTTEYLYSGVQGKLKGLGIEFSFESSPQVQHILRWEGVWRHLRCLSLTTPFEIREEAGHSVKSSLKHILCMGQRADALLPSQGSYFRLDQEFAGLGGNVNFLKHEVEYQINKCVIGDLVLQATLMGGLAHTCGLDESIKINDRFFLGGPLTLRGFSMNSIGPHAQDCFLGAEAYWAGGLHAYAPLPFRPLKGVLDKVCRTHIFINAGNIGNFAFTGDYHHNAMVLLSQLRWSCGIGLVFSVAGVARFELNYCMIMSSQPEDKAKEGLQSGIWSTFPLKSFVEVKEVTFSIKKTSSV